MISPALQGAGSQVPLWIQIGAALLAPVFGFVGVIYGARMGSKHQHEQWLRQQRLQAYVEFVRTAESLTVDYFGGFEELLEKKDDLERRVRLLGELSAGIDLLGPDEVAACASKIDEWLVDGLNFEVKAEHLGRTLPVGDVAIEAQEMLPKFRRLAAHHVRATK